MFASEREVKRKYVAFHQQSSVTRRRLDGQKYVPCGVPPYLFPSAYHGGQCGGGRGGGAYLVDLSAFVSVVILYVLLHHPREVVAGWPCCRCDVHRELLYRYRFAISLCWKKTKS